MTDKAQINQFVSVHLTNQSSLALVVGWADTKAATLTRDEARELRDFLTEWLGDGDRR